MQVKQKTPMERKRNVIYEVPCCDCQLTYIEETRRTMKKRITEHKYAVKTGGPKNGITVHTQKSQHSIDWESKEQRSKPLPLHTGTGGPWRPSTSGRRKSP